MGKKILLTICLIASACGLASCASIVNGTHQNVSVNTSPVFGASCVLSNDKGRWYISSTPTTVAVSRSYKELTVKCYKPGYVNGYKLVASKTKAMAFGNIVFGGVIGAGVDMADGAAFDYPDDITVPMRKK